MQSFFYILHTRALVKSRNTIKVWVERYFGCPDSIVLILGDQINAYPIKIEQNCYTAYRHTIQHMTILFNTQP